jgi:mannosyltransferase
MEKQSAVNGKKDPPLRTVFLCLSVILITGTFLRFYGLSNQSLWYDEIFSWDLSHGKSLSDVVAEAAKDTHPPGHAIVLYFTENYLGDSEFWLRFPSAIGGVLSILGMYLLGRRLFAHWEGIYAAACMSIFWYPIYFSQEARSYSLTLLFTEFAFFFWISLYRHQTGQMKFSILEYIGYLMCSIVTMYLHYYGMLVILLQGVILFVSSIKRIKATIITVLLYVPLLLAYIPWLQLALNQYQLHDLIWLPEPKIDLFFTTYHSFFNRSEIVKNLALLLCLVPLMISVYESYKRKDYSIFGFSSSSAEWLLMLWLIVPFLFGYLVSNIFKPMITIRYLFVSIPPAYLLVARGIQKIRIKQTYRHGITCFLILIALFDLVIIKKYYSQPTKEQFREAVAYVVKKDPTLTRSLIIGTTWKSSHLDYYLRRLGSPRKVDIVAGAKEDIKSVSDILNAQDPRNIWIIRAHRRINDEFLAFFSENYALVDRSSFIDADVWLFLKKVIE